MKTVTKKDSQMETNEIRGRKHPSWYRRWKKELQIYEGLSLEAKKERKKKHGNSKHQGNDE
jgi:hypothetical protein